MTFRNLFKIITDIFMVIIFIFLMLYDFTGEKIHKLLGIFLFIFTIFHIFLNSSWYKSFFKGRYNFKRIFKTAVILILFNIFIIIFFTGIKILQYKRMEISYEIYSSIHFYFAYLGIFFIVIHFIQSKKFNIFLINKGLLQICKK